MFKGTIIENSLEDTSILEKVKILGTRNAGSWILHDVLIEEKEILGLQAALSDGPWYIHVWQEGSDEVVVLFKDAVFTIHYSDKSTWVDAVAYGKSIGIPEGQLDFKIH